MLMSSKFNPVETLQIEGRTLDVRQMPFLKALEFLKKLGAIAGQLFDTQGKFLLLKKKATGPSATDNSQTPAAIAQLATYDINVEQLTKFIQESGDLATFLIQHSTRQDNAFIENLSLGEGLAILHKAIEMNLSPEIQELGKALAGSLAAALSKTPAKSSSQKLSTS